MPKYTCRSPLAQPATVLPECVRALVWQVVGINPGQEYVGDARDTYIMGRHEECNLSSPNDEDYITISRYHCLLDVNPLAICIRDFGSMSCWQC
jgi:FHA domain